MIDHMSRDCPNPRMNGTNGQERRTERDTLSGAHSLLTEIDVRKSCYYK